MSNTVTIFACFNCVTDRVSKWHPLISRVWSNQTADVGISGLGWSLFLIITIKPLIWGTPNSKTQMFLVLSSSGLWSIHWSQVLSWEWRCSWSSADRWCSNYIWVIKNLINKTKVCHIKGLAVVEIMWFNTQATLLIYIEANHYQIIVNHQHATYNPLWNCKYPYVRF